MDEDIVSGLLTIGLMIVGLLASGASAWAKRRARKSAGPVAEAPEEPAAAVLDGRDGFRVAKGKRRASLPTGKPGRGAAAPSRAPAPVMPEEQPADEPADEPLAGEFDLRRAVIYSEILKPKFREEDNF